MRQRSVSLARSLFIIALTMALFACDPGPPPEPRAPVSGAAHDLVVVCIDTVRYDAFWAIDHFAGGDDLSPWTDRGLRYSRAQAPAPWTIPAVASLLTGLEPQRHGAGGFPAEVANLNEQVPTALPQEVPTLGSALEAEGYDSAAFVAHPWFKPDFGLDRGFDDLWFRQGWENIFGQGVEWLDHHRRRYPERPFFLYLHLMEAHERHMEPTARVAEIAAALPDDWRRAALATAPAGICDDTKATVCHRWLAYLDAIRDLRQGMAGLLAEMERLGVLQATRVVLYSDHGEEFHDHRAAERKRGADPRGFYGVGHGHSLYQELLHVPLVLWEPGRGGEIIERRVSLLDVAATVLPAEVAAELPGVDLLEGASEAGAGAEGRLLFASGIAYGPPQAAVVDEAWKRVVKARPSERVLFHLGEDPEETAPRQDPEISRRLDRSIAGYLQLKPAGEAGSVDLSDEDLESLRALGYLGSREN